MLTFIHTLRQQYHLRQTLVQLQRRADDRLLEDIGLTRADLANLAHGVPARTQGRGPVAVQRA